MSYRDYHEIKLALRIQYEGEKAILEELAERLKDTEVFASKQVMSVLANLGFKIDHADRGSVVYVREEDTGLEVLAQKNFAEPRDIKPHLYQIPTGQKFQDWYNNTLVPLTMTEKKKADDTRDYSALIALPASVALGYFLHSQGSGMVGTITGIILGGILIYAVGVALITQVRRDNSIKRQIVARGPDTLRIIANNSKYVPKMRVVPIVDEEFTDEKAREEHQATLEALAEEQEARVRRK